MERCLPSPILMYRVPRIPERLLHAPHPLLSALLALVGKECEEIEGVSCPREPVALDSVKPKAKWVRLGVPCYHSGHLIQLFGAEATKVPATTESGKGVTSDYVT